MRSYPDAVLMLADCRQRELQDEATRRGLAREIYGDDPTLHSAISTACRQLGTTLGGRIQQLESIRRTISLTCRGAFPR
jgi:hypothetical protein